MNLANYKNDSILLTIFMIVGNGRELSRISTFVLSCKAVSTSYASYGQNDVVTLTMTTDIESEPSVTFTSGGDAVTGSVTVTGSGTSWTASYTKNVKLID